MRKYKLLILLMLLLINIFAYAIDFPIFDLRNRIYEEAKRIKQLLPTSSDGVILLSIVDSCHIVIQQLDAYFYMLGIFESIDKDNIAYAAVDNIQAWLNQIKATNAISLKSLNSFTDIKDQATKEHIAKVKAFFLELNLRLEQESNKLTVIKRAIPLKRKKGSVGVKSVR